MAMDAGDIGGAFHTALRKAMDGTVSVASWNLLHVLPVEVKRSFYGHLASVLDEASFDAAGLRKAALDWKELALEDPELRGRSHEIQVFNAILELHSHQDWTAIAQFMRSCGLAAEIAWAVDERSHWIDGWGFKVSVSLFDDNNVPLGKAELRLRTADGKPLNHWWGSCITGEGLKSDGGTEVVADLIEKARASVAAARMARKEELVRPEAVAALRGFALSAPLDAADPFDARVIALSDPAATVIVRRPTRMEGEDRVNYTIAMPDALSPTGWRFHVASIYQEHPDRDRLRVSALQRWTEEGAPGGSKKFTLGVDDDLVTGRIEVTSRDDGLSLVSSLSKLGKDEGELCRSEVEMIEITPAPRQ